MRVREREEEREGDSAISAFKKREKWVEMSPPHTHTPPPAILVLRYDVSV